MRLLAVAAATALLSVTPAGGAIVVQRSIAGVALGMTKAQVRAILGSPTRVRDGKSPAGHFVQLVYGRVTVEFQDAPHVTVTTLRTSSRLERTATGVGVGSTERAVRRAVPDVACYGWKGGRQCILGKLLPGRAVTIFELERGHVTELVVGIVHHS